MPYFGRPPSTLLEYQHLYQTEASMNSIQLEVIHQTQEGMPYQRLHFQIMTDDGIITPEDHPNADKLIGSTKIPCSSNG